MKTLIHGGLLIDPANRVCARLNLLMENGRIAAVTPDTPAADRVVDAAGKVVCPGFVDIHMHEDPLGPDGKIYADPQRSIFHCMLRMGVTTAVGGNCGENTCHPADYLDLVDRDGAPVHVAMLAGHGYFRQAAGCTDKYSHATPQQQSQMASDIARALNRGCLGISYGIRYIPGIDRAELLTTAAACQASGKLIAAHIRSDAGQVFDSLREFLDVGRTLHLPLQVSHLGSMAGFGQMQQVLQMVDESSMNGLDISCDCYPYAAFSTSLGSTTYDPGWLERYQCGYDVVELCSGKYKDQRCTKEIFDEVRRDDPDCITVCYVMKQEDVDLAFRHPNVMLGSDGVLHSGQGHPRAAGAFPRFISQFADKLTLYEAIHKMTAMPAQRLGLSGKGRLNVGADADVVVFDPSAIRDCATFADPIAPPLGIDSVWIGGQQAVAEDTVLRDDLGRALRK